MSKHPEQKAPAPEATQKIAGGKRRTATAGGEVRDARPPDGRAKNHSGGAEEGNGRNVQADIAPTEGVDLKLNTSLDAGITPATERDERWWLDHFARTSFRAQNQRVALQTALTRRLGLAHPIIQAPLAGGGDTPDLVAAVGEAGALGFIGAAYLSPSRIREACRAVRDRTSRPFGINLFAPAPDPVLPSDP